MTQGKVPNVKQLYEQILKKESLPLPGMEKTLKIRAMERAKKIHAYLLDRADRLDVRCDCCWERFARGRFTHYVYETPWDEEETEKHFCSEECEEAYLYTGDFSYFLCERCLREICSQNPSNGWHIQYREYDGEIICLKCYQEAILKDGVEREKLEKGIIPGMFFSWDNREAKEAGYREVLGFTNFYIHDQESLDAF